MSRIGYVYLMNHPGLRSVIPLLHEHIVSGVTQNLIRGAHTLHPRWRNACRHHRTYGVRAYLWV